MYGLEIVGLGGAQGTPVALYATNALLNSRRAKPFALNPKVPIFAAESLPLRYSFQSLGEALYACAKDPQCWFLGKKIWRLLTSVFARWVFLQERYWIWGDSRFFCFKHSSKRWRLQVTAAMHEAGRSGIPCPAIHDQP